MTLGVERVSHFDAYAVRMSAIRCALKGLDGHDANVMRAIAREAIDDPAAAVMLARDIAQAFIQTSETPVLDDFALSAFNYALGRMTSVPSAVSEYLQANWSGFQPETRETILSGIRTALEKDRAGMSCDRRVWEAVIRFDASLELPHESGVLPTV